MELQEIKRYFFARRNGVTADVLRRAGSGFEMIFGVDLPSISALAREIGPDTELAMKLWEDAKVRESHLLASWLMDPQKLGFDECMRLTMTVKDQEDAMMLAFRVLKRREDAREILDRLKALPEAALADTPAFWSAKALERHLE